jgi:hypothetical protein
VLPGDSTPKWKWKLFPNRPGGFESRVSEPIHSKALFRIVVAFSGGKPVEVFNLQEDWLRPGGLAATASAGASLKVAVAKNHCGLDFDSADWPESFAVAYEEFVNDPEGSSEHFDWIEP